MKKTYENILVEMIVTSAEDVIATSGYLKLEESAFAGRSTSMKEFMA